MFISQIAEANGETLFVVPLLVNGIRLFEEWHGRRWLASEAIAVAEDIECPRSGALFLQAGGVILPIREQGMQQFNLGLVRPQLEVKGI